MPGASRHCPRWTVARKTRDSTPTFEPHPHTAAGRSSWLTVFPPVNGRSHSPPWLKELSESSQVAAQHGGPRPVGQAAELPKIRASNEMRGLGRRRMD